MGSLFEDIELTPIQQFYNGSKIFVTGASGFFGRILLEKLLRSCPNISTIYILLRKKRGEDLQARTKEIFDDVPFQGLRTERRNFQDKVVAIDGDCNLPNLGIGPEDLEMLKKEVTVIFHLAATVRFTEKLKTATFINIRATRDLLNIAHEMPKLKVLIHVSTAFSNCIRKVIEEKIYPPALDGNTIITMAENLPDDVLNNMSDMLLGKYPNTYTFTKQIAEAVVKENGSDLPIGVFRAACAVSTYKEPVKGWNNTLYAVNGVATYVSLGVLRTTCGDSSCKSTLIPVDMCMNGLIAAAWDVGTAFEASKTQKKYEIPVYHYESNTDNPISWGSFMDKTMRYAEEIPSSKAIWYQSFAIIRNQAVYAVFKFFLHILPALIWDFISYCSGKRPTLLKKYSKLHTFVDVLYYFSSREWTYKSQNTKELINKMTDKDKEIFFADLKQLDWDEFMKSYFYGIRLYLLDDPKDTIPEAKKKWTRLYWAHKFVTTSFRLCLLWLCLYILKVVCL